MGERSHDEELLRDIVWDPLLFPMDDHVILQMCDARSLEVRVRLLRRSGMTKRCDTTGGTTNQEKKVRVGGVGMDGRT